MNTAKHRAWATSSRITSYNVCYTKLLRTKINVTSREAGDIIMMGIGGFTPLTGFMTRADWEGVCDGMKMANGLFWPIPITLSTDESTANGISEGDDIALADSESGEILATRITSYNVCYTKLLRSAVKR